ncbi:hypothetical protein PROFUN_01835 [Planoprotostelium fungivorum]|uniref:Uncharacterized protein n=1 Tax=Planoprotostelium fungivorum TaxID=1890364 RepID=A0A2P6NYT7_9EUKA|nr:hypothetical protein PROFUN_01835 [Planoprotostelium fungivorum]
MALKKAEADFSFDPITATTGALHANFENITELDELPPSNSATIFSLPNTPPPSKESHRNRSASHIKTRWMSPLEYGLLRARPIRSERRNRYRSERIEFHDGVMYAATGRSIWSIREDQPPERWEKHPSEITNMVMASDKTALYTTHKNDHLHRWSLRARSRGSSEWYLPGIFNLAVLGNHILYSTSDKLILYDLSNCQEIQHLETPSGSNSIIRATKEWFHVIIGDTQLIWRPNRDIETYSIPAGQLCHYVNKRGLVPISTESRLTIDPSSCFTIGHHIVAISDGTAIVFRRISIDRYEYLQTLRPASRDDRYLFVRCDEKSNTIQLFTPSMMDVYHMQEITKEELHDGELWLIYNDFWVWEVESSLQLKNRAGDVLCKIKLPSGIALQKIFLHGDLFVFQTDKDISVYSLVNFQPIVRFEGDILRYTPRTLTYHISGGVETHRSMRDWEIISGNSSLPVLKSFEHSVISRDVATWIHHHDYSGNFSHRAYSRSESDTTSLVSNVWDRADRSSGNVLEYLDCYAYIGELHPIEADLKEYLSQGLKIEKHTELIADAVCTALEMQNWNFLEDLLLLLDGGDGNRLRLNERAERFIMGRVVYDDKSFLEHFIELPFIYNHTAVWSSMFARPGHQLDCFTLWMQSQGAPDPKPNRPVALKGDQEGPYTDLEEGYIDHDPHVQVTKDTPWNERTRGWMMLHYAIFHAHENGVQKILQMKETSQKDEKQETPLRDGEDNSVINRPDAHGRTPLSYAFNMNETPTRHDNVTPLDSNSGRTLSEREWRETFDYRMECNFSSDSLSCVKSLLNHHPQPKLLSEEKGTGYTPYDRVTMLYAEGIKRLGEYYKVPDDLWLLESDKQMHSHRDEIVDMFNRKLVNHRTLFAVRRFIERSIPFFFWLFAIGLSAVGGSTANEPSNYVLYQYIVNGLTTSASWNGISSSIDVPIWMNNTLLPWVAATDWYDDENPPNTSTGNPNRLMGAILIRQHRSPLNICDIPFQLDQSLTACIPSATPQYDRRDYGPSKIDSAFTFANTGSDYYGIDHFHWPSGGYSFILYPSESPLATVQNTQMMPDINRSREILQEKLDRGWLDERTRMLTVSFTLWNTGANKWASITLGAEFGSIGPGRTSSAIYIQKGLRYRGIAASLLGFMEAYILFYFITYAVSIKVIFKIIRKRCALSPQKLKNSYTYIGLNLSLPSTEYYDYSFLFQVQYAQYCLTAFFVGAMAIKTLQHFKVLPYTGPVVSAYMRTVLDKRFVLFGLFFIYLTLMWAVAYHIVFGFTTDGNKTFYDSILSSVRALLGESQYPSIAPVAPIFGPIFYVGFAVSENIILLNLVIAVLNEVYAKHSEESVYRWEVSISLLYSKDIKKRLKYRTMWNKIKKRLSLLGVLKDQYKWLINKITENVSQISLSEEQIDDICISWRTTKEGGKMESMIRDATIESSRSQAALQEQVNKLTVMMEAQNQAFDMQKKMMEGQKAMIEGQKAMMEEQTRLIQASLALPRRCDDKSDIVVKKLLFIPGAYRTRKIQTIVVYPCDMLENICDHHRVPVGRSSCGFFCG